MKKFDKFTIVFIVLFTFGIACLIGTCISVNHKISAYVESTPIADPEVREILNTNLADSVGRNLNNAWMNIQDLMKGGE